MRKRMLNMKTPKVPGISKWITGASVIAAIIVTWLFMSGCAALAPIDKTVELLESTRSNSGELDERVSAVKEVLEIVRSDVSAVANIVSSDAGSLSKILGIGSLFGGPIVSIAGALLGIGGIGTALKKRKDLRSLASALVRVAGDDGKIDTKDELTKARLSAMSPGANSAIREAQGKA